MRRIVLATAAASALAGFAAPSYAHSAAHCAPIIAWIPQGRLSIGLGPLMTIGSQYQKCLDDPAPDPTPTHTSYCQKLANGNYVCTTN